jgi:hypothetical protein
MSIQALKASLPELSDAAFERTYRQFLLKALAPVLGYEVSRRREAENWDEILDCFEAERERRMNKEITQGGWETFCNRFEKSRSAHRRARARAQPKGASPPTEAEGA